MADECAARPRGSWRPFMHPLPAPHHQHTLTRIVGEWLWAQKRNLGRRGATGNGVSPLIGQRPADAHEPRGGWRGVARPALRAPARWVRERSPCSWRQTAVAGERRWRVSESADGNNAKNPERARAQRTDSARLPLTGPTHHRPERGRSAAPRCPQVRRNMGRPLSHAKPAKIKAACFFFVLFQRVSASPT